jgi:hypothetical protein
MEHSKKMDEIVKEHMEKKKKERDDRTSKMV